MVKSLTENSKQGIDQYDEIQLDQQRSTHVITPTEALTTEGPIYYYNNNSGKIIRHFSDRGNRGTLGQFICRGSWGQCDFISLSACADILLYQKETFATDFQPYCFHINICLKTRAPWNKDGFLVFEFLTLYLVCYIE